MAGDGDGKRPLHIVMFPWLAFGHIIPFLELSKALARKGHKISFLSTPRNIQRLPKIPPHLSPLIDLVQFPLPRSSDEELPEGAEATSDLPPAAVQHLKTAFDGLEGPFADFLDRASSRPSHRPDWIVHDFANYWIGRRVAAEFRIPCALFTVFPPWAMAFLGPPAEMTNPVLGGSRTSPEQFTSPPPWISSTAVHSTMAYRLHEARVLYPAVYQTNASGVGDCYRLGSAIETSQMVIMRGFPDMDYDWLSILGELYGGKQVVAAGQLPPSAAQDSGGGRGAAEIFEWLDKQTPRSVVYVAFGSEATLSVDLLHELALGLDISKLPFLWALRKPGSGGEILPEGFERRTQGRGLVSMNWVPQFAVLAHPSIGGFLTHSGWSSVVEDLQFGHPMVLLPIFAEQPLNARRVVEMGVGWEVPRDEEDGSFTRDAVAETVRAVVVGDEGAALREEARRMAAVFGDSGRNDRCVDDLVRCMAAEPGGRSTP